MLAKLADLKLRVGIASGDTGQDTLLTTLLTNAGYLLSAYCSRGFEYAGAVSVEYFDGGGLDLRLRTFPISTSTAALVRIAIDNDFTAASDEAATGYVVNAARGVITRRPRSLRWPDGDQNVRVTYYGGFLDPTTPASPDRGLVTVPPHVQEAALLTATDLWRRKDEPGYKRTWGSGEQTDGFAPALELLPMVKQLLNEERRLT